MTDGFKLVLLFAEIVTVASALLVAFHPNVLYAAIALLFTFLGVSVMFVYAGADFLAGAQVIVYVGGVTILILFAIMLTQWLYQVNLRDLRDKLFVPILMGLALLPLLFRGVTELGAYVTSLNAQNVEAFSAAPKTPVIGAALLGPYLLPFEAITILLLGALIGAVWIARPAK